MTRWPAWDKVKGGTLCSGAGFFTTQLQSRGRRGVGDRSPKTNQTFKQSKYHGNCFGDRHAISMIEGVLPTSVAFDNLSAKAERMLGIRLRTLEVRSSIALLQRRHPAFILQNITFTITCRQLVQYYSEFVIALPSNIQVLQIVIRLPLP